MTDRDLPVRHDLVIPGRELREAASRSGGPGGQHVNKTSTRVTLRWNVRESEVLRTAERRRLLRRLGARLTRGGDLVVHARRHRSRARNRELARQRLAELVAEALRARRPRVAMRPGPAARQRRLDAKQRRARVKHSRRPVHPDE